MLAICSSVLVAKDSTSITKPLFTVWSTCVLTELFQQCGLLIALPTTHDMNSYMEYIHKSHVTNTIRTNNTNNTTTTDITSSDNTKIENYFKIILEVTGGVLEDWLYRVTLQEYIEYIPVLFHIALLGVSTITFDNTLG